MSSLSPGAPIRAQESGAIVAVRGHFTLARPLPHTPVRREHRPPRSEGWISLHCHIVFATGIWDTWETFRTPISGAQVASQKGSEWRLCLAISELTQEPLEDEDSIWMNHYGTYEDITIETLRSSMMGNKCPTTPKMPQAPPDIPHLRFPTAQMRRMPPWCSWLERQMSQLPGPLQPLAWVWWAIKPGIAPQWQLAHGEQTIVTSPLARVVASLRTILPRGDTYCEGCGLITYTNTPEDRLLCADCQRLILMWVDPWTMGHLRERSYGLGQTISLPPIMHFTGDTWTAWTPASIEPTAPYFALRRYFRESLDSLSMLRAKAIDASQKAREHKASYHIEEEKQYRGGRMRRPLPV